MLYDAVNLYPSLPSDKAINVLIDTLINDKEQLKERTKLIEKDKITKICLSNCYFLYENNLRFFQNSGPIAHSLMVVLPGSSLQKIDRKVILEAFNYKIAAKTFRRVDEIHARFQERSHADKFLEILNK